MDNIKQNKRYINALDDGAVKAVGILLDVLKLEYTSQVTEIIIKYHLKASAGLKSNDTTGKIVADTFSQIVSGYTK